MQLFKKPNAETVSDEVEQKTDDNFSEQYVFMFSFVPLKLIGTKGRDKENVILWANPKPSSTTFCRPIKFLYIKETQAHTQREFSKTQSEIDNLEPFEFVVQGTKLPPTYYRIYIIFIIYRIIPLITDKSIEAVRGKGV